MIHQLKCATQHFEAVLSGRKTYEIRENDRCFEVGDFLALNEWAVPEGDSPGHTGRCCLVEVAYILDDSRYLVSGMVCMGIRPCAISRSTERMARFSDNIYLVPVYDQTKEAY